MDFNNDLHRELFALFILESNDYPPATEYDHLCVAEFRHSFQWHDRSYAPESYTGYVFEYGWNTYNMILVEKEKCKKHTHKVSIYFEE